MKVATKVITCEITQIEKGKNVVASPATEEDAREIALALKYRLNADDVVVTGIQVFETEESAT